MSVLIKENEKKQYNVDELFKENVVDFCYVNSNNHVIIDYKILKNILDETTYTLVADKLMELFDMVLKVDRTIIVHLNLKYLNLIEVNKYQNYLYFLTNLFNLKYPDKLEICYIYECPFLFNTFYNIISSFIDKKTQGKLKFVD